MNIGASNAVLTLTIPGVISSPTQLQGFAADDIYDLDEIDSVETLMGVDGILSGGFVFKTFMQHIMLQSDSPSNALFDAWYNQMTGAQGTYVANGVLTLPQIGLKMVQTTGFLRGYKLPGAKKLIQPRRYRIEWGRIVAQPA